MSYAERVSVTVVTIADGSATAFSGRVTGRLHTCLYVKTDYADTVDFTITSEATGETLWTESNVTASKTISPRQATHSTAGVATLYAAGGAAVLDAVVLANDRIKIVLAQGGDTKTGTFNFVMS